MAGQSLSRTITAPEADGARRPGRQQLVLPPGLPEAHQVRHRPHRTPLIRCCKPLLVTQILDVGDHGDLHSRHWRPALSAHQTSMTCEGSQRAPDSLPHIMRYCVE